MTKTTQLILTFVAACVTALAVTDPIGLPQWVQVVAGVLATGFAAIGIPAASNSVVVRNDPPA